MFRQAPYSQPVSSSLVDLDADANVITASIMLLLKAGQ